MRQQNESTRGICIAHSKIISPKETITAQVSVEELDKDFLWIDLDKEFRILIDGLKNTQHIILLRIWAKPEKKSSSIG